MDVFYTCSSDLQGQLPSASQVNIDCNDVKDSNLLENDCFIETFNDSCFISNFDYSNKFSDTIVVENLDLDCKDCHLNIKFSEYFDVNFTHSICNCILGIEFGFKESVSDTIKSVHSAFEVKDISFLSEFCADCTDECYFSN